MTTETKHEPELRKRLISTKRVRVRYGGPGDTRERDWQNVPINPDGIHALCELEAQDARIAELEAAVRKAMLTFEQYASSHARKAIEAEAKDEHDERVKKGEANMHLAFEMRAALGEQP